MPHVSSWLFLVATVVYSAAAVVSLGVLVGTLREAVAWIPRLAIAGMGVHLAGLIFRFVEGGGFPEFALREILFLLAFAGISVYLLAHFKYRLEVMGVILLPLIVALMAVTVLIPEKPERITEGWKLSLRALHIIPAVLGVSFLFLTFATSVVYLVQEYGLKKHRPFRSSLPLPSLERCDRLSYISLGWGFAFLTLVVVTGALTNRYMKGDFSWLTRERFSLLAWILFAVVIYDRVFAGRWRGRLSAYLSIIGFVAILIRMVGIGS